MLFDIISPIYALFFDYQVKYYKKILNRIKNEVDISKYKRVLDLGCGTGALSYALQDLGIEVVGVDPSSGMLKQARKKLKGTQVELIKINPGEKLPFDEDSFDLAISSYVIHGLNPMERKEIYKELCRISKGKVIFHDYNQNRSLITDIAEFLENGDYFNFIKVAKSEMEKHFKDVKVVDVDKKAAWYILKHCNI
ncbi:class I SAM-dependent methyltransferase [Schnuerera sp.]|uniref:class I SAM-dependent methyltransferase n=1 Tax=Schnuerera sp. TaxID=2794844 RepID=UPI002CC451F9|nr:class I SAM-dependent methyltransferase [Schnuerera sp.]HSH35097.1 class I SAM-dependent methyltransferase [Schnuerera sp.]